MTLASTISLNVAVIGVLFALLTVRLSFGPGLRELRPFAACAFLAAIYSACNAVVTLPLADDVIAGASRLGLFAAGLHGSMWFVYNAAQEQRPLSRFDRAMVVTGVAAGVLALVPRLCVSEVMSSRPVPWLNVIYRDAVPTRFGTVVYALYCFGLVVLLLRYARKWHQGQLNALPHFLGLAALFSAGVNDSLTAARVYDAPYLLDFGFLTVVACVGALLTTRFIASARSLEAQAAQLSATQAELVKRERLAALGELSAVVAHEVRNPVAIMFNALSVLRRQQKAGGETETLLAIVEEEAERLRRMVDELLAFARPQALRAVPSNVVALVASAVDAVKRSETTARLVMDVPTDLPPITCDEHLVRGALINLLSNAVHVSRQREPVRVRATLELVDGRRHLCIAVIDDGDGIPAEQIPRLFTPFFTTRATGTGLGLAVVRRIAEAHGGEARLASTSSDGSTFVLRLPIESAPAKPPRRAANAPN